MAGPLTKDTRSAGHAAVVSSSVGLRRVSWNGFAHSKAAIDPDNRLTLFVFGDERLMHLFAERNNSRRIVGLAANPDRVGVDELNRMPRLHMCGEQHDGQLREVLAPAACGPRPIITGVGRHLDVDDHEVRAVLVHRRYERVGVSDPSPERLPRSSSTLGRPSRNNTTSSAITMRAGSPPGPSSPESWSGEASPRFCSVSRSRCRARDRDGSGQRILIERLSAVRRVGGVPGLVAVMRTLGRMVRPLSAFRTFLDTLT